MSSFQWQPFLHPASQDVAWFHLCTTQPVKMYNNKILNMYIYLMVHGTWHILMYFEIAIGALFVVHVHALPNQWLIILSWLKPATVLSSFFIFKFISAYFLWHNTLRLFNFFPHVLIFYSHSHVRCTLGLLFMFMGI